MLKSVLAALGLLAASLCANAQKQAAPVVSSVTEALIRRAFDYSFPLHEMGALRLARLGDGTKPGTAQLAHLTHVRRLSGPADRRVTAPNNDTLYSSAWLDLANGPIRLSLPDTHGRYYSVALLDSNTDTVDIVGRRKTGTREAEFVIVGPRWEGSIPDGSRVIRASTDDVFVLVRLLVDGEPDLPLARALQDQFSVAPLSPGLSTRPLWKSVAPAQASAAERYLTIVNEMLERNPPPTYETKLVQSLAEVGVCGARCTWSGLTPQLQEQWARLLPTLLKELKGRAKMSDDHASGWSATRPTIGRFGTDYAYRAYIALVGLLALEPAEAMYPTTQIDHRQQALDGSHRYRLHLPSGGIPVDAFWSLTMYQPEDDGRFFFAQNPINRYSIGDRTSGLVKNPDGSIDILIQHDQPTGDKAANWLPAPVGPLRLALRAYLPRAELRERKWKVPSLTRV